MAGKGDTRRPESVRDKVGCDGGHAMPDKWGRCWRCGEKIAEAAPAPRVPDEVLDDGTRVYRSGNVTQFEREFHASVLPRELVEDFARDRSAQWRAERDAGLAAAGH